MSHSSSTSGSITGSVASGSTGSSIGSSVGSTLGQVLGSSTAAAAGTQLLPRTGMGSWMFYVLLAVVALAIIALLSSIATFLVKRFL